MLFRSVGRVALPIFEGHAVVCGFAERGSEDGGRAFAANDAASDEVQYDCSPALREQLAVGAEDVALRDPVCWYAADVFRSVSALLSVDVAARIAV